MESESDHPAADASLLDDDDDGVPEDEDDEEEDDVEAKILQLQDQFQEVKQQRKEARLVRVSPILSDSSFRYVSVFPPCPTTKSWGTDGTISEMV